MRPATDTRLDVLKGALICLVVLGHAVQFIVYGWAVGRPGEAFADPVFRGIYIFHMPLFFMVSGYLRGLRPVETGAWWGFVLRRTLRLLLPAVAWYLVSRLCLAVFLGGRLLPGPSQFLYELLMQAWFVWCVYAYELAAGLLRRAGLDGGAGFAVLAVAALFLPEGGILFLVQYGLPYWALGYVLGRRLPPAAAAAWVDGRRWLWLLAAVPPLLAWCWRPEWWVYVDGWSLPGHGAAGVFLRFSAQLAAAVCAGLVLLRLSGFRRLHPLALPGRESLGVYLAQSCGFYVLGLLLGRWFPSAGARVEWTGLLAVGVFAALLVMGGCLAAVSVARRSRVGALLLAGAGWGRPRAAVADAPEVPRS